MHWTALLLTLVLGNEINADNCGIRKNINLGRIVGGREAYRNEFPWTVALQRLNGDDYTHFCGAVVINERWLLTAAHCFNSQSIRKIRAVFGATDLTIENEFEFTSRIEKIVRHKAFNRSSYENDIALLKTKEIIPIDATKKRINSICLPEQDEKFYGQAHVSGWGRIDEDDDTTDQLKVLKINLYHDSDCKDLYNETFFPDLMLCAGYFKGRRDACEGDSGGPLEKVMHSRVYSIGIVSFGRGCARETFPGVYTEVSHYVNWIKRRLEEDKEEKSQRITENKTHSFRAVNNCAFNVWMSIMGNWGKSTPADGGFQLKPKENKSFLVEQRWSGRIWGRTGCETGVCETGDCGNGGEGCKSIGKPPATLIEMVMDYEQKDVYSISLIDGFNLPLSVKPTGGFNQTSDDPFECKEAACYGNINDGCPSDLAVTNTGGKVIACKSACVAKNEDKFCCRNAYMNEAECLQSYASTNYLTHFHGKCPKARTILFYDEPRATYQCHSNPLTHYQIEFCPVSSQ